MKCATHSGSVKTGPFHPIGPFAPVYYILLPLINGGLPLIFLGCACAPQVTNRTVKCLGPMTPGMQTKCLRVLHSPTFTGPTPPLHAAKADMPPASRDIGVD